ncbi:hypothetical protein [Streptomyces sp. NPDC059168]|uniref:hypothetical protein n=1 Tax=Streptomyces sp. NPDC059168 TaxID=3346753 RepID=UPI0036A7878F
MLGYLHIGKLADAADVAEVVMADGHTPADKESDALVDLAVGELLLRNGDSRRSGWIDDLVQHSPFRLDAAVLAWELARRTPGADAVAAAQKVRELGEGALPVLSGSLSRLVRCFRWATKVVSERFDESTEYASSYLRAGVPGVFVAYTGRDPEKPIIAAKAPGGWRQLDIAPMLQEVCRTNYVVHVPSSPEESLLLTLAKIRAQLIEYEKGYNREARRLPLAAVPLAVARVFLSLLLLTSVLVGGKYLVNGLGLHGSFSWALSGVATGLYAMLHTIVILVARRLRDVYSSDGIKFALREREIPWSGAASTLGPAVARLITRNG